VFLVGFLLFGAASALCGLAPTIYWLIAARVVQGVGGALVQANTGALITHAFPPRERGRALGLNSSMVSAGLLSGPLIGGVITQYLGWRWAFYVNVPISAIAAPVGWRLLRPSAVSREQRLDLPGAFLFLAAVVALLLGLNQGDTWGWTSPATVGTFLLCVLAAVAFVVVELRVPQPMVDLTMFRNQAFSAAVASAFLGFLAIAPVILLMPFYYQLVLGVSVDASGLLLVAIPATTVFLAPLSGVLSDRVGTRLLASAGLLIEAVGLGSLVFLSQEGPAIVAAAHLVIVGVGVALFQTPNSSALFSSVSRSRLGLVGGFQALTRNLGQSLGQAIAGVAWTMVVVGVSGAATAVDAPPAAMMTGFRAVFAWSAALTLVGAIVSLFGRPRGQRTREPRAALPEPVGAGEAAG